ncbi:hypothetical protein E3J74_09505 [Candidatus Bathyarchaeota archaeon]|nr:MAG: hypothetical protein E3J74_09505 [Candidatus Bathyarchaeota archaeon]TEU06811.1 MAG: hypothetical protein E3I90_01505 [Candidatus Bathyarchaeota archaeon]
MRSKALIFFLAISFILTVLGFFLFTFEGGFGGRGHGMGDQIPQSFLLLLFFGPLVALLSVLGYTLIFPELGEGKPKVEPSSVPTVEKGESALSAVLRVLNEDERKVIEILVAEGGTMLQKDIRWKTGLSRVKTHRILFRLAKRGIVSAEKHYNTNKITLADWLKNKKGLKND